MDGKERDSHSLQSSCFGVSLLLVVSVDCHQQECHVGESEVLRPFPDILFGDQYYQKELQVQFGRDNECTFSKLLCSIFLINAQLIQRQDTPGAVVLRFACLFCLAH